VFVGRRRLVPVAVTLTNLAVPVVNQQLRLLISRDVTRDVNGLGLCWIDGGEAAVALAPHAPLPVMGNYMLVLSHWKKPPV